MFDFLLSEPAPEPPVDPIMVLFANCLGREPTFQEREAFMQAVRDGIREGCEERKAK